MPARWGCASKRRGAGSSRGYLSGEQLPSGAIVLFEPAERKEITEPKGVAIYARVSAAENRLDLERQAERLIAYSSAEGYQISQVVKEVGSGVHDSRPDFSNCSQILPFA
jgi:putative resolvase